MELFETIVIEPQQTANSCVIWLHGLGADASDFENIVPELGLPENHRIRFVFPRAPYRPITLNMHMKMRAWYDVYTLDSLDHMDEVGIEDTCFRLHQYIAQLNIDSQHILLAGFSQGGSIALLAGLTLTSPLAGILGMSTFMPYLHDLQKMPEILQKNMAILLSHGNYDDIVPIHIGQATRDHLNSIQQQVEWHEYPMGHHVCSQQIKQAGNWIADRLMK